MFGRDAGAESSVYLKTTAGIDVQALAMEDPEYGGAGTGFHSVACREPKRVGKPQGHLCLPFQQTLVVNESRGSELPLDLPRLFGLEEGQMAKR